MHIILLHPQHTIGLRRCRAIGYILQLVVDLMVQAPHFHSYLTIMLIDMEVQTAYGSAVLAEVLCTKWMAMRPQSTYTARRKLGRRHGNEVQDTREIIGVKKRGLCTSAYSVQGVIAKRPKSKYMADGKLGKGHENDVHDTEQGGQVCSGLLASKNLSSKLNWVKSQRMNGGRNGIAS